MKGSGRFFDIAVGGFFGEILDSLFGLGAALGPLLKMRLDDLQRLAVRQLLHDRDLSRHAVEG